MVRFYDNLWQNGLPKLEALRQAQLGTLRGSGGRGADPPATIRLGGRRPQRRLVLMDGSYAGR
jgi:CHAT domain-containing protein